MKTLSLKLDDLVYKETEQVLEKLKKPRNRYINEALQYYNRLQKRKLLGKILEAESEIVREESLRILAEFENLDEYDT
jgi:thermostable 8-oxoguanine DNA glycosylase